jgi:hypothetical protein
MQKKFFGELPKVKIICKTAMVCTKMHGACGKGISIKNIYVSELSYPTTKKIYKFKGAT